MKHPPAKDYGTQAGSRLIPRDWIRRPRSHSSAHTPPSQSQPTDRAGPRKWLTTLPAPLADVRDAAMGALTEMNAVLAYRYEADGRIVIRSTLPHRQIRAEMTSLEAEATRVIVVTMNGSEVDRATSSRVIEATEKKLEQKGF